MSSQEQFVIMVVLVVGVAFVVTVGWLFHWFVLDRRYWFRWLPKVLPGPVILADQLRRAGEPDNYVTCVDAETWDQLDADTAADLLIAEWRDDSPGPVAPAPRAGGHHLGAPYERTITGDIWDQWWEGLDGLNRECLLVTAWVGRESAAWAELVAETREMCAA